LSVQTLNNMNKFAHLTPEQRYKIDALINATNSINQKQIAEQIGVSEATISRELRRNSRPRAGYQGKHAQELSEKRRFVKPFKIIGKLEEQVRAKLEEEWSPEQIVGRMTLDKTSDEELSVSHETIYKYVYRKQKKGDKLYVKLRRKRKKHRKRLKKDDNRGKIPNKIMIDKRPQIVNDKERIGDWEADTIIGLEHQSAILTLAERKSKFTLIFPLQAKTAQEVEDKITIAFESTNIPVWTITFDNGKEFTNHENIAKNLGCQTYFAFPYHSWERGLNENTNGLIRQYIPKKQCFKEIDPDFIKNVQNKLNNRPRKTLNYLTPIEYLKNMKIAFEN
jgi:transposase, IS30 family